MTILEPIINEASEQYGLRGKAGPLMTSLLSMVVNERTGGLQGFLDQFRRAGFGEAVSTWVSRGANVPITPEQLERAVGAETINRIASSVSVPRAATASALAFMVPRIVDLLSPEGVIPARAPAWINTYLTGATGRTEPVRSETVRTESVRPPSQPPRRADTGRSTFLRLLPLLLLPLFGFLAYRACRHEPEQIGMNVPAPVSPTPTVTVQPPAQTQIQGPNSRLSLVNSGGKIRYSGVVPNEQTRVAIVNQLGSTFGAENVRGDISVDSRARNALWVSGLAAALPNIKTSGAELSFDGDAINVGGSVSEGAKSDMVASLKSIYGDGLRVGSFDVASSVAESERMASEALSSLKPGYTAEDLTTALNKQIINFSSGSAQIPRDSMELLEQSASAIKSAPSGTVLEISGHTDNVGNTAANEKLSQQRADSVRRFLINQGVSTDSLVAKGFGSSKPIAGNDTQDGRFRNRRIEYTTLR